MNPVRKTASAGNGHIAAIHILKAQLQMTQEDYRALLVALTGEDSCKGMSDKDLKTVRLHMHRLVSAMGVATGKFKPFPFVKMAKKPLEPIEKKVWAVWYALEAKGLVQVAESRQARAKALRAYVTRQTGAADMAFCTGEQLNKLVEAMKKWLERGKDETLEAVK